MSAPTTPPPGPEYFAQWTLGSEVKRTTVDLTAFPDLVVMYLGMRVNALRGLPTLLKFGRRIASSVEPYPDGLLRHERVIWSPRHLGMRQYWRDFDSLERWARSPPHLEWWKEYLQDTRGTGFWHETYSARGGFEAIYDNVDSPIGLLAFAPREPAVGGMFSARRRRERAAHAVVLGREDQGARSDGSPKPDE